MNLSSSTSTVNTKSLYNINFVQCWSNVEDVEPTLYKCYTNVLSSMGERRYYYSTQRQCPLTLQVIRYCFLPLWSSFNRRNQLSYAILIYNARVLVSIDHVNPHFSISIRMCFIRIWCECDNLSQQTRNIPLLLILC